MVFFIFMQRYIRAIALRFKNRPEPLVDMIDCHTSRPPTTLRPLPGARIRPTRRYLQRYCQHFRSRGAAGRHAQLLVALIAVGVTRTADASAQFSVAHQHNTPTTMIARHSRARPTRRDMRDGLAAAVSRKRLWCAYFCRRPDAEILRRYSPSRPVAFISRPAAARRIIEGDFRHWAAGRWNTRH